MAITNLITGELRNKVGAMVGAKWKGINYVRAYVKPKNPKTEGQQAVRSQFGKITHFGSAINEGVLKPYLAKVPKNMSPYNYFVKLNKELVTSEHFDYDGMKIFNGSLPTASGFTASASEAEQEVRVRFTPYQHGTAKEDDTLIGVVYNEAQDTFGYGTILRGSTSAELSLNISLYFKEGDMLFVYLTGFQKNVANGSTLSLAVEAEA